MIQILETDNYGKFVLSNFNRDVKKTWNLEATMLEFGWKDAYPMDVKRLEDGRLEIRDGHHRFFVARKLGIPVKYVECQDDITMAQRVLTVVPWSLRDFLDSFARTGLAAYTAILEYHQRTGINLSSCISMLAEDSGGTGNSSKQFKDGTYRLGDQTHANLVAEIALQCKKYKFRWWNSAAFLQSIAKIVRAEGFDPQVLKSKIASFSEDLKREISWQKYIDLLEKIYNRRNQVKLPLAFKAAEAARKRNAAVQASKRVKCRTGAQA